MYASFVRQIKVLRNFITDTSGHFAIWTAIMAVPLLGLTTFVLDYHAAQRIEQELKGALDATVLATVANQLFTEKEKNAFADKYFAQNFAHAKDFKLQTDVPREGEFEITASGNHATTISAVFGIKDIPISQKSRAAVTRENVICILTLNPDGENSFHVYRNSEFNSPNCAVQVNSSHKDAAFVDNTSKAVAKDFCVTGGARGHFQPYANTECTPVKDPYADHVAPKPDKCKNTPAKIVELDSITGAEIGNDVTLLPGTYCQNLILTGKNVTMMPGTYILKKARMLIEDGATVKADGVTIVLTGAKSRIQVKRGSSLYLKAPDTGEMAGLAIFQDKAATLSDPNLAGMPSTFSQLVGGSDMTIVGTVYIPTQAIDIKGRSLYANAAPATSYIGYDVMMGRGSHLSVDVDHARAGLPPILPRSDEGVRLVE